MSIEEAKEILNEAVITEPSVKSYNYISADEINLAIEKVINELENKENRIKELEIKSTRKVYTTKKRYMVYAY